MAKAFLMLSTFVQLLTHSGEKNNNCHRVIIFGGIELFVHCTSKASNTPVGTGSATTDGSPHSILSAPHNPIICLLLGNCFEITSESCLFNVILQRKRLVGGSLVVYHLPIDVEVGCVLIGCSTARGSDGGRETWDIHSAVFSLLAGLESSPFKSICWPPPTLLPTSLGSTSTSHPHDTRSSSSVLSAPCWWW